MDIMVPGTPGEPVLAVRPVIQVNHVVMEQSCALDHAYVTQGLNVKDRIAQLRAQIVLHVMLAAAHVGLNSYLSHL